MLELSTEAQSLVNAASSVPVLRIKRGIHGAKPTTPKNPNAPIMVRVLTPGGKPLGKVSIEEARNRIFTRVAKGVGGRGKREFSAIQMLKPQVADKLPGGMRLHYAEDLGNHHHLCALKRYNQKSGTFHKWHPELTFTDVRRGRMAPPKQREGVSVSTVRASDAR